MTYSISFLSKECWVSVVVKERMKLKNLSEDSPLMLRVAMYLFLLAQWSLCSCVSLMYCFGTDPMGSVAFWGLLMKLVASLKTCARLHCYVWVPPLNPAHPYLWGKETPDHRSAHFFMSLLPVSWVRSTEMVSFLSLFQIFGVWVAGTVTKSSPGSSP